MLPLLEENFEKLSKSQRSPYLYQKVKNTNPKALSLLNMDNVKNAFSKEHTFLHIFGQLANKKVLSKKPTLFSMLAIELQTLNLPVPPGN